jgi:glutathione S-transferase
MAESYDIAKYLDEAYPDTPKLFPDDESQVQAVKEFCDGFIGIVRPPGLRLILCKGVLARLNPASQEHFSKARARNLYPFYQKHRLEDVTLSPEEEAEEWKKIKGCFDDLEERIKGTDDKGQ